MCLERTLTPVNSGIIRKTLPAGERPPKKRFPYLTLRGPQLICGVPDESEAIVTFFEPCHWTPGNSAWGRARVLPGMSEASHGTRRPAPETSRDRTRAAPSGFLDIYSLGGLQHRLVANSHATSTWYQGARAKPKMKKPDGWISAPREASLARR